MGCASTRIALSLTLVSTLVSMLFVYVGLTLLMMCLCCAEYIHVFERVLSDSQLGLYVSKRAGKGVCTDIVCLFVCVGGEDSLRNPVQPNSCLLSASWPLQTDLSEWCRMTVVCC